MRKGYYYCVIYNNELVYYLDSKKIMYEVTKYNQSWIIFTIYSTMQNYEQILQDLEKMKIRSPRVFKEYSASDYSQAEFLTFLPYKQSIDILNDDSVTYLCSWTNSLGNSVHDHEIQIKDFIVRKEPPMNKRTAFWGESTGEMNVFADYRARDLVKTNNLIGIEFRNVYLKKGNKSEKLFQLTTPNILTEEQIVFGYGEKVYHCPNCGKAKYGINDAYQLHIDFSKIKEKSDLYITDTLFGDMVGYPIYIISQRFYQLLKKYNLHGGLKLTPVILLNNETSKESN